MRLVLRTVVLFIAGLFSAPAAANPPVRTALVIHELTPNYPWFIGTYTGFQSILNKQSTSPVYHYVESLGITQFGNEQYYDLLRNQFREKYRQKPIGVIVSFGPLALPYVIRLRNELWPGVPLIFSWVDHEDAARQSIAGDVTGTTYRRTPQDLFKTARALVPRLKRIALVGDPIGRDNFSKTFMNELSATDLGVIDLTPFPMAELKKRVSNLPDDAAIAYPGISMDGAGARYVPRQALTEIAEVANRPIFVDAETFIGAGATGGLVIDPQEMGRDAAELAIRILNGESAASIPVTLGDFSKPIFDWGQLRRWGIEVSRLPLNSEIRFRPPTLWEQYRWQVTAVLVALLVQSAMISWMLIERYGRRKAELESRRRSLEVMHLNRTAEVGALSASFAHEISQPLVSIMLVAEAAERLLLAKPDHRLKEMLGQIRQANQQAVDIIQHLKKLLKRRSEVETQEFDLNDVIADAMYALFPEARDRNVALHANDAGQPLLVRADRIHLQQVIVSLTMNGMDAMIDTALDARRITIEAALRGEAIVEVSVSDTGKGIPEDKISEIFETFYTTKEQGTGLGLSVASTIVETYGGKIWAENRAGGGAVFRFTLPLVC
jgi:signal transduction histidine kinase